jgi:CRP-like cAMP-binding protein
MSTATSRVEKIHDARVENRILSAISRAEYEDLLPALKPVRLARGAVLYEAGSTVYDCYFPTSGMVSLLGTTEEGNAVEVAMVGNEGMIGVASILNARKISYRVMTQVATDALKVRTHAIQERSNRCGTLHAVLMRYIHALLCQVSQSVVCNRFHVVEQRLCRWLLVSGDRAHSDTFQLTQEAISHMLGVPRTNIIMTLGALQRKNLIRFKRGEISIVDRRGMEMIVCECYRVVRDQIDEFFE